MALDGLRALALIWVLLAHVIWYALPFVERDVQRELYFSGTTYSLMRTAGPVDVFFGISGFLIGGIVIREMRRTNTVRFSRFFARRLMRLLPPYLLAMGAYALVFPEPNGHMFWSNVLFVNNYVPHTELFMDWAWTMAVEMHFLLAIPFIAWAAYRNPRIGLAVLLALLVASVVVRFVWVPSMDLGLSFRATHTRFGAFIPGLLFAHFVEFHRDRLERLLAPRATRAAALAGSAAVIAGMFWRNPFFDGPGTTTLTITLTAVEQVVLVSAFLVIAFVLRHDAERGALKRILTSKPLYAVAQLTYSAYLLHPIVIVIVYAVVGAPTTIAEAALYAPFLIAAILLTSVVSYLLVERPVIEMRAPMSTPLLAVDASSTAPSQSIANGR